MNAQVIKLQPAESHLVPTTPDDAHAALVERFVTIEEGQHSLACAVYDAYTCEAWMRDNGEHEHRYRLLMMEKGFGSIFHAYAFDEFGFKAGSIDQLKRNGRLIELTQTYGDDISAIHRASTKALGPLSAAGVLSTTEPERLVEVLDVAAQLADESATARDIATGRPSPITSTIVKAAMKKVGVGEYVPPKSEEDAEIEAAERRAATIAAARKRLDKDVLTLASNSQRAALRDLACRIVRILSDQPKLLADITKEIDDVG